MAICRNIQNNDVYRYLGDGEFLNVRTGKSGKLDEDKAKDILKINLPATAMFSEYPIIEELINRLNLKFDTNGDTILPNL